ncbi:transcriptional regulator [Burkholderia anthina]|uniref:transcriptional regulator n=1 Tax=Burkholderia anthina TaxID=179879 RepID=UPI001CF20E61|nr:transcriptional regulator [Burkholderia anthina]MCA8093352.1 transcriptional regulator [Burkholderia anthina]
MSDQDVKAYSRQVKQAPVATRRPAAAKPAQRPAGSQSTVPAAAHADAKPASKAPAAAVAAKARTVQHAGKADPKQQAAAKSKATRVARTGAETVH